MHLVLALFFLPRFILNIPLNDHYQLGRCAVYRDRNNLKATDDSYLSESYLEKFLLGFHHPAGLIAGYEMDETVLRGKKHGMIYQRSFERMIKQRNGISPTARIHPINDPPGSIAYFFPPEVDGYHEYQDQYFEYPHDARRFLEGVKSVVLGKDEDGEQGERVFCRRLRRSLKYRMAQNQRTPCLANEFIYREKLERLKAIIKRDWNHLLWQVSSDCK